MIAITIENSTYCGADCLTCIRKRMHNANQNMEDVFFNEVFDGINNWNTGEVSALSFVGMGDPLLDPGFENKVRYVKEHSDLKIHLTNTCQQLKGDVLDAVCRYVDSVKISHYACSEDTYKKVHGNISYQEVVKNIEALLGRKDRPRVTMTFLSIPENKHEKDAWIKRWEKQCDSVDVWTPHNWGGNYRKAMEKGEARSCNRPGKDFQIHVDVTVSVCCLDACEDWVIGDLNDSKWGEIVKGSELRRIVELHKAGRFKECGICADCDMIYDRKDALIYSTGNKLKIGQKAGYETNAVTFA